MGRRSAWLAENPDSDAAAEVEAEWKRMQTTYAARLAEFNGWIGGDGYRLTSLLAEVLVRAAA